MTAPIEVTTLGQLRVCVNGHELAHLHSHRKPLGLLVLLAVERAVPRERTVALLWSDSPGRNARHSLSQALLQLKTSIPGDWLDTTRDTIAVSSELQCDAVSFEQLINAGDAEQAVRLYRGNFLDGFNPRVAAFEQWAGRKAAHFAVLVRDAMRQLIAAQVAEQRVERALELARNWVACSGEEDEAQHRLIELLAATGRRAEALEHFELYRRELASEDLTPLEETLSLVERIRRGESLGPLTTMTRSDATRAGTLRTRRFGSRTVDGPRLVRIADGGVEAESYFLEPGTTRIGRVDGDITFPLDPLLQPSHALIELAAAEAGAPRLVLRDVSQRGGVYIRIHGSWPLRDGDRFRVGQQQFRFETGPVDPP